MGNTLFELKGFVLSHKDLADPGKEVSCFERNSTNLPSVTPAAPSMSQEDKHEVRTFSKGKKRKRTTVTKIWLKLIPRQFSASCTAGKQIQMDSCSSHVWSLTQRRPETAAVPSPALLPIACGWMEFCACQGNWFSFNDLVVKNVPLLFLISDYVLLVLHFLHLTSIVCFPIATSISW